MKSMKTEEDGGQKASWIDDIWHIDEIQFTFLMCKIYVQKFWVTPSWSERVNLPKICAPWLLLTNGFTLWPSKKVLPTALPPWYLSKKHVSLVSSVKIDWAHFWHAYIYIIYNFFSNMVPLKGVTFLSHTRRNKEAKPRNSCFPTAVFHGLWLVVSYRVPKAPSNKSYVFWMKKIL